LLSCQQVLLSLAQPPQAAQPPLLPALLPQQPSAHKPWGQQCWPPAAVAALLLQLPCVPGWQSINSSSKPPALLLLLL
jgi:hypothetical protein